MLNPPLVIALTGNDLRKAVAKAYMPEYKPKPGGRSIELPKDQGPGPAAPSARSDPTVTPGMSRQTGHAMPATPRRSIALNPTENWTPEHHLAHHLQGMDFHSRNTQGGTGSAEYQQHLKGARHAVSTLGASTSKLTPQHYSESAQAFPPHIQSKLGKSNPGLYIGG